MSAFSANKFTLNRHFFSPFRRLAAANHPELVYHGVASLAKQTERFLDGIRQISQLFAETGFCGVKGCEDCFLIDSLFKASHDMREQTSVKQDSALATICSSVGFDFLRLA